VAKIPGFLRQIRVVYETKKTPRSSGQKVTGPQTMVNLFRDLQEETKEKLITVSFDDKHKILCFEVVAIGGKNVGYARPMEIFKGSFLTGATSAVVLHNNLSGKTKPNIADIAFTNRMLDASDTIGLKLLDHIIVGFDGFYSFASQGKLAPRFQPYPA